MPGVRAFLTVTIVVVACASCQGDTETPTAQAPTESTTSQPSSPTPTVPPYLAKYTPHERDAYQAAVHAYSAFAERNSEFLAKGRTTRAASDFYHRYAIDWVEAWANLVQLADNDVTVDGLTRIVWTRPKSIKLDPSGSAGLVLVRCLDESRLKVTQGGKPLDQPQLKDPHVYRVRLEKATAEARWRSGVAVQGSTC
jgi:hypothetical protein